MKRLQSHLEDPRLYGSICLAILAFCVGFAAGNLPDMRTIAPKRHRRSF